MLGCRLLGGLHVARVWGGPLLVAMLLALLPARGQEATAEAGQGASLATFRQAHADAAPGELIAALREWLKAPHEPAEVVEAELWLGRTLVQAGDLTNGRRDLEQWLKEHPEHPQAATAQLAVGDAWAAFGQFGRAVLAWRATWQKYPDHTAAATAAWQEGVIAGGLQANPQREREALTFLVEKFPEDPRVPAAWSRLGAVAAQAKQYGPATEAYLQFARSSPTARAPNGLHLQATSAAEALWQGAILAGRRKEWQQAVACFLEWEKLPGTAPGEGLWEAARIAAAHPEAGDATDLFQQSLAISGRADRLHEYARWLQGRKKQEESLAQYRRLLAHPHATWAQREAAAKALGLEAVAAYLKEQPDYPLASWFLAQCKDPKRQPLAREQLGHWLPRPGLTYKLALLRDWAEITGEAEDGARYLAQAEAEGRIDVLAPALAQQLRGLANPGGAGQAFTVAQAYLAKWSPYPDTVQPVIGEALAEVALAVPLATEDATNPEGQALRQQLLALVAQYPALADGPKSAAAIAGIAAAVSPAAAREHLTRACILNLQAGHRATAEALYKQLREDLPLTEPRVLAILAAAAEADHKPLQPWFKDELAPAARQALGELAKSKEADAAYGRWQLAAYEPKQAVPIADAFLAAHPRDPRTPAVRAGRWRWLSRQDQGVQVAQEIAAAVQQGDLAAIPAIPADLFPREAALALATRITEDKPPKALRQRLTLHLGTVELAHGRHAAAFLAAARVLQEGATDEVTQAARKLGVRVFAQGYFPAGLGQAEAEQAFAWLMAEAVAGRVPKFAELAGPLWFIACHPAGRWRGFDTYNSLYLHSYHDNTGKPDSPEDQQRRHEQHLPGDGTGPTTVVQNGASPYAPGDKFMLWRWGRLYAPEPGTYEFWFNGDDWVGLAIDGDHWNFGRDRNSHVRLELTAGLHLLRVGYGDWGGGHSGQMDWQGPGISKRRFGPGGSGYGTVPAILSAAAAQGTAGLDAWDRYLQTFPHDARAQTIRRLTLAWSDPAKGEAAFRKAAGETPENLELLAWRADCLWRSGRRGEALDQWSELTARPDWGRWQWGANTYLKRYAAGDQEPISWAADHAVRVREAGDWERLQRLGFSDNRLGALNARFAAIDQERRWREQLAAQQASVKRLGTQIEQDRAQREAAEQLAAKDDVEADVRTKARAQAAAITRRLDRLEQRRDLAAAAAQEQERRLQAFRRELGLQDGEDSLPLLLPTARALVATGQLPPARALAIADSLAAADQAHEAAPFRRYALRHGHDYHTLIQAARDLLEALPEGDPQGQAHDILAEALRFGAAHPRDRHHAEVLRNCCEWALPRGEVYAFALAAQLLHQAHPKDQRYNRYVERLGEVFERAGNVASAESEYQRQIRASRDPKGKRAAKLRLSRLYQRNGRPREALAVLSTLAELSLPEDQSKRPRR